MAVLLASASQLSVSKTRGGGLSLSTHHSVSHREAGSGHLNTQYILAECMSIGHKIGSVLLFREMFLEWVGFEQDLEMERLNPAC